MLKIYNSLTRKKEPLIPINPGKIGMYVCGITVYDDCHLGHARTAVCFDVIVRFLRSQNYTVTFVRNITDIDDKIIKRANERGISIQELTKQYIKSMHEDFNALNIIAPDKEPRATDHIKTIINVIERLIAKGIAYVSDNGDVCYEVDKFNDYGKLAHKDIEGLISGARIEVMNSKNSPLDFVLWKKAKKNEPSWPSPWGDGRPGWHIECSAMALDALGETFDIHGGGLDLQFPHHENEIAQSEGATDKPFANYWLHVGMLQINQEKMAKSLGNFLTIKNVLEQNNVEVIRYFLLSSHYRSPLNYSEENILNAKKGLTRLYQALKDVDLKDERQKDNKNLIDKNWVIDFNNAMKDDFNTPVALSVLFSLSRELNKTKSPVLAHTLKYLANILGLMHESVESFLNIGINIDNDEKFSIEDMIDKRNKARSEKNWIQADEIRKNLLLQGIELEDSENGTIWRKI